jgi:hypothetical protein
VREFELEGRFEYVERKGNEPEGLLKTTWTTAGAYVCACSSWIPTPSPP